MIQQPVNLPEYFLKPGELLITDKPGLVKTVLGSCLTVTMFSHKPRLSAICHAVFNDARNIHNCSETCIACTTETFNNTSFKYVSCAITTMIKEFNKFSINPEHTEVKVFGGASLLRSNDKEPTTGSVGENNIRTALQLLSKIGIKITSSDTGGCAGRRLLFYTHTGEVYLKRLIEARKH